MEENQRPIDAAMNVLRPAKATVRQLWVEEVRIRKELTAPNVPFYLTLPGAEGHDIKALIDEGLIETTETNAIADIDNRRVIAVESNSLSVLKLLRKYPGLKVIEKNISDQLRGTSPLVFPIGEDQRMMRATVVNLDFNGRLLHQDGLFPVLEYLMKLEALHRVPTELDWTLLLTLQGEITWDESVQLDSQSLLIDTCEEYVSLANGCRTLFGEELYSRFSEGKFVNLAEQDRTMQQAFLMSFVPVHLIPRATPVGWRLDVVRSIRYGGEPGVAPMVTWIIRFIRDSRTASIPSQVKRQSVDTITSSYAAIDATGAISCLCTE